MLRHVFQSMLTGMAAIGMGVALWIVSVSILDPLFRGLRDQVDVWAVTLWSCVGSATFFISSRQWATRPALGCTIAWLLFVTAFGVGEGGIGADVNATLWAYANLIAVTPGVVLVSHYGVQFRARRVKRLPLLH